MLGFGEHRHHSAAFGQTAKDTASFGEEPHPVLQAEYPGDTRSHVLAHAVPDHHVGLDAPRLPQPGQAHFHREECWLGKAGVLQGLPVFFIGVEEDVQQWIRQYIVEYFGASCHGVGEYRLHVEQLANHLRVLAALPGE